MSEYMAAQMDSQIEGAISENEQLRQENDALRKDAERYRWLRANGEPDAGMAYRPDWTIDMYDAAIDAAMAAESAIGAA